MAICQGLGLALAIGIGGPIAALFISMMGSLDAGIDPDGTDYGSSPPPGSSSRCSPLVVLSRRWRGQRAHARIPDRPPRCDRGDRFAASLAEEGTPPGRA